MNALTTTSAPTGGIGAFLTEGATIPEGSALKASTSQTILPEWYSNYAMNLLAGQQATSAQPYATYQGPRVAGFTPVQEQGFGLTHQAAGSYAPALQAGINLTGDQAGRSAAGAAQPFLGQAAGINPGNAAYPYYGGALAAIGQGTQVNGLEAARPLINMAGRSATDVSSYMDPYIGSVVDRIGDLGARNLREKFLPEIEGRYIGAGQWGGSGQMTETARAVRDVGDDVLAQQRAALSAGYGQAQGAMQTDLNRFGQLGSTVGNLAAGQQGALLRAGEMQSQMGTSMGNLEQARQQNLTQIGSTLGGLTNNDTTQGLATAEQLARLAGMQQQYGLTGANAITGVGAQQQQLNQQNLDVAYQDFLRQQGYPQEQINAMLATFKGVAPGVATGSSEYGIVPQGYPEEYKPGTAATIASGLAGLGGLVTAIGGL